MGASWRIGVDPNDRTDLVTAGLFGMVRNPIFTAMFLSAAGSALAVPTAVTVLGFVVATAGIVAQVLLVRGAAPAAAARPHLRRLPGPVGAISAAAGLRRPGRAVSWVPVDACSLRTPEPPLRAAEFDALRFDGRPRARTCMSQPGGIRQVPAAEGR